MKKLLFLLCLIPALVQGQILNMTNIKQPANANPTLSPSTLLLDLGSVVQGNAGTDFTITLNGSNLSAATVVLTWTGNTEGSKDGSSWGGTQTYSVATGTIPGQPVTVHSRIKSTAPVSTISGLIQIRSTGALPVDVSLTGSVTTVPSLSANPTSITGLNGVTGTAGTPQTVSVTFQASTITATAPTNTEVSQDGGGSWAASQIFSTGSPKGVQIRTKSAAGAGAISGNLALTGTGGVSSVNVPVSGTVTSSAVTPDSIKFQFNITSGFLVSGWTQVLGDPSTGVRSGSVAGTTVTYSTVATSSNNWGQFAGACIGASNGITNAVIPDLSNRNVMKEAVLTSNVYNTSFPQFVIGGLKTDGTRYDLELSCATQYVLSTLGVYDVKGLTLQTSQQLQGYFNPGGPNTSVSLYWDGSVGNDHTGTGFLPDASGNITIYFGTLEPSQQVALLAYIKVWDHSKH